MPLSPGTRLGPYEIVAALGSGGMGEVYRARDTRLGRDVAVKVLPQHLTANSEVRARFEREARAVSSLNHPHICTLHDVGREGDTDYLVMELVEGETLAQRLAKGAMPVADVLRLGVEITEALEQAHRAGVIHRDLKPGNIMLTRSGAKLMDFGLARAAARSASGATGLTAALTQSPTVAAPLTAEGTIVGTFHYMAPEQLEGGEADARSDVWSLGCVLYEMTTGRRPFEGKSQASLIGAIMNAEPVSLVQSAPLVPPGLDRLVRACLEKDPERRVQTAHDAGLQLRWIAEGGSQAGVPVPVAEHRRSRERLAWGLAAVAALVAALLGALLVTKRPARPRTMRFTLAAPAGTLNARWPRVSPDGGQLAFLASDSAGTRIWIRPLDAFEAHPLPGAETPGRPFWSPDVRFLGYFAGGKLRRIAAAGGPSIPVGDSPGSDGSWGKDVIVFDGSAADSIRMIPADGGAVQPASRIDRAHGETGAAWPCFLPDGRHFLYLGLTFGGSGNIRLGTVGSLESRLLGRTDGRIEFAPPGYLVFPLEGTLMAQRFDLRRLVTVGEPVPIGERLTLGNTSGEFSVSRTGMLVYRAGSEGKSRLVWLDRTGKVLDASCPPGGYSNLSLAPDGKRAVVDIQTAGARGDLWLQDFSRGVLSRLTFTGSAFWPTMAHDGDRIAYTSNLSGEFRVYIMSLSARERVDSLAHVAGTQEGPDGWSRDGHWLLVDRLGGTKSFDVVAFPMEGGGEPVTVAATTFAEREARFSPDGKWVAYASNESGRNEVYVQSFPQAANRAQVSTNGGLQPSWRGDGRELYYIAPDQAVMAVPIRLEPALEAGNPVRLFTVPLVSEGNVQCRLVPSDDGQRFLGNVADRTSQAEEFSVIDAWTGELRSR